MDALDMKALSLLCRNGRFSWADLAQQLNLSAPAAAERIRKLEERRIIHGYTAVLDAPALGYRMTAFVGVTLGKSKHHKSFLRAVRKCPEVLECHRVSGDEDYFLKVTVRDTAHLDAFVFGFLRSLDGVRHARTVVVLSTLKSESFAWDDRLQTSEAE